MQLLFSARETIATLVKYKCKTFITLTPVFVFLFSTGEGSCLVFETTSLDHGDIPTGFVRGSGTGKVKSALPGTMVDV